jgi:phosphopantetheinyl transferase
MDATVYIVGCELGGQIGHEAGRALLATLYKTHVGGQLPTICVTSQGKPYFLDSPWHFSITHTRRHAFCVLSDQPVGIDAEESDRQVDLRLAEKILSPGEYAQFSAAADPRLALLTFWVLKEADAKRTGEGIRFHPRHTDFSLHDPRLQHRDGCLLAVIL